MLSIPPAFAAIAYISKAVAAMPFSVYRKTDNGSKEADGHPVFSLFTGRPHPHYTRYTFFQSLVANALLGDGYARIHFDAMMRPAYLELLPSGSVWAEYAPDGTLYYRVSGSLNGKQVSTVLADFEVLHIKGVSFNGINGLPVRLIHADTFGTATQSQRYSNNFFKNGAHVSGVVTTPGVLPAGGAERLRNEFFKSFGGVDKVASVPVLDGGMDFKKIGLNPQEAAVMDFRKLTAQDCSRIWQIPLHLLSELERSTFTNMEQQTADFVTHTVLPLVRQIEQELNSKLFTTSEIRRGAYFCRFNLNGLMRADSESRAKFYTAGIQNGWLTPNDVRLLENMNTVDGGDDLLIQLNMQKMKDMQPPADPAGGAPNSDTEPIQASENGNAKQGNASRNN